MARLIDANELAKKIQKVLAEVPNHRGSAAYTVLALVGYLIESSQTVDAVPVVHGYWIRMSDNPLVNKFTCSVCGCASLHGNY